MVLCSPPLARARSWNGLVQGNHVQDGDVRLSREGLSGVRDSSGTVSVSESSGSIVGGRMFERSAPAAPEQGLDRAWVAARAHDALLFGGNNGHLVDRQPAGRGGGGVGGDGWRRGYREADQLRLLDSIVRGRYCVQSNLVGQAGRAFITEVVWTCLLQWNFRFARVLAWFLCE